MKELSLLIPARNEMFLKNTIDDAIKNIEADTEIIAVLDGAWAQPPIPQHEKVVIVYLHESIGQRAATNVAAKLSKAKYVMKLDAHCSFDKGFDRKMIEFFEKVGEDVTAVPIMRNLHAFDWKCRRCGWTKYQGPTPKRCEKCKDSRYIKRDMKWIGKHNPQSTSFCFDSEPHFQYNEPWKHRTEYQMGAIVGYKLFFDSSVISPSIIHLLADFTRSHQFTMLPNSSWFWENMSSYTKDFSSINNSWGIGIQKIGFIRDKSEMERIATLPVLTNVVNYGYILTSSTGDRINEPRISKPMCEGFLSEFSTPTVTPFINSPSPDPTTRRVINSDTLNKFNSILGGEFVYSEKRKSFHNGSVALVPIYVKDYTETMSLQGSAFMSTRKNYWDLELCDEKLGSWGNQGIEVAAKTWLSGGRVLVNHNTWYAHMFRTQGGDFGFPYKLGGKHVSRTKHRIKNLFWENKWPKQKYPLSWLVKRFWPVTGWTQEALDKITEKKLE